jgi:3D (Asp-Asp-Asp) domain-containing protein
MNIRKQILIGLLLASTLAPSAQAGMMDWFRSSQSTSKTVSGESFDQVFGSIANSESAASDENPTIVAQSIIGTSKTSAATSKVTRTAYTVEVSGYNSEARQTDDSPFITAKGTHVRDGIVATNMFPFGTAIKIPALFGDKIFVVEDRMNKRYQRNVDIWMADKSEALKLGRRTVQIEVIH